MSWQRSGDTAATYPKLMAVRADRKADERTINEVAGWLWRCSTQSAGHLTDYLVDVGTAEMLGGSRTAELVRLCKKTGLLTVERLAGVMQYRILDDPDFIHVRLRVEVEWERQQRNDTRDHRLKVPVVIRDGDNCRYCGVLTMWRGKTSNRTWTLDHRVPGQAGAIETMVVACKGCNSARMSNPQWDDDHPLRPPPERQLYGRWAAQYLTENGYPTRQNVESEAERPAPARGAEPAPKSVRPATATSDDPAEVPPELDAKSTSNSQPCADRTGPPGSGRDGSASGSSDISPSVRRRRGRRGGRPQSSPRGES